MATVYSMASFYNGDKTPNKVYYEREGKQMFYGLSGQIKLSSGFSTEQLKPQIDK